MKTELGAGAPPSLEIATLGPLDIRSAGRSLTAELPLKGQALLVYLTLAAQSVPRTALAGLLWPEMPEESARTNLRLTLSRLRRQLPPDALEATRQTLSFNRAQPHHIDAVALQAHASQPHTTAAGDLEAALQRVRGEFLQGFELPHAPAFEQWVLARRAHYHQLALDGYTYLLRQTRRRGDLAAAIHLARRLLTLEPWYEEGHRQLMALLALSGERSAALAQYESCRRLLQQELDVAPGAETIALYEQIRDGRFPQSQQADATADDAPIPSLALPPVPALPPVQQRLEQPPSLPPQRTPFIGRQVELALLQDRVLDPHSRLITIVGEGGVGKTRLALALASRLRDHAGAPFPDGIAFASLAELALAQSEPEDGEPSAHAAGRLAVPLGAALGLNFATAQEPRLQLLNYLRHKACLLIVDNFELLLPDGAGAARFLLDLLDSAPRVTLLLTSRSPLNLQAEYLFRLQGLAVPEQPPPHGVADYDSLLLFRERAERAAGRPLSLEQELPAITQICRAVAGLPLGIELAASWMRWRTAQEIAAALTTSDDFQAGDLLAQAPQDLPPRHRSLETVFEHSWRLLAPSARAVLAQLSQFQGPFSAAAALFVSQSAHAQLAALVDSSLLQRSLEGYYQCHDLVRRFAAGKCTALGVDPSTLRRRHAAYYMAFIGDMAPALNGKEPRAALRRVQAELNNVLAAWQEAINAPHSQLLARGLPGMVEYWSMTGLFREAHAGFAHALQKLQALSPAPDPALLSLLYAELAGTLFEIGHYEDAEDEARRALQLAQQLEQHALIASARLALGRALWGKGRSEDAHEQFEQAHAAARLAADPATEAVALRNLAAVRWRNGEHAQALAACREARTLNRKIGHVRNESRDLLMLGILADNEHRYDDAHALFEQLLQIGLEIGDRRLTMAAYAEIGVTATHQGRLDRALHYLQQNLTMVRETGSLWHEGVTTANLGDLKLKLGEFDGAEAAYRAALDMAREASAPVLETNILSFWSLLDHFRSRHAAGIRRARQSLQIAQELNTPRELAFAAHFLAHNLLANGDAHEARAYYQEAYNGWQSLQHQARAYEALAGLAAAALAGGDEQTALAHASELFTFLRDNELQGADDPSRVYLACYDVFSAANDARAATVLQLGLRRLHQRAAQIADANLRHAFLEKLPTNARLRRLTSPSAAP